MCPTTISELTRLAIQFRDERDWKQFHNPKDMALSLALETSEVLELMQWKNGDELQQHLEANRARLGEELSDVLFWVLAMANDFSIDLGEAFKQKLIKNAHKYPIEKAKGVSTKYTEL
jgi:NTP pyrophosphatase (non-canonical NTP hydrolase)